MRPPTTANRRTLVALIQFAGVVLCVSALTLAEILPAWTITAALVGLGLLLILGLIVVGRPVARTPVDLSLGLMLLLAFINLLSTADPTTTLPHVLKTISGIALFWAVVGLLRETGWTRLCAIVVCVAGLVLVPFVLFGVHWSSVKLSWLPWVPADLFPRILRPFWKPEGYSGFNPSMAGGVLAMVLPVPVAYTLLRQPKHAWGFGVRLAAGLVAVGMSLTLLLTQSRGALLAALVAVAVMLAARDWRWFAVAGTLLLVGAALFQTVGFEPPPAWDLTSDAESAINSAAGRIELWSRAWSMLQDFPFTGIGMGMTNDVARLRYPPFRIPATATTDHAHNVLFTAGAEMGYPGVVGLLAFLIGLLGFSWQTCRRLVHTSSDTAQLPLAVGSLGSCVVFVVHGLTDAVTYSTRANLVAWALFGVAVGVGAFVRKSG